MQSLNSLRRTTNLVSLISLIRSFMVPLEVPCETKGGETEAGEIKVKTN